MMNNLWKSYWMGLALAGLTVISISAQPAPGGGGPDGGGPSGGGSGGGPTGGGGSRDGKPGPGSRGSGPPEQRPSGGSSGIRPPDGPGSRPQGRPGSIFTERIRRPPAPIASRPFKVTPPPRFNPYWRHHPDYTWDYDDGRIVDFSGAVYPITYVMPGDDEDDLSSASSADYQVIERDGRRWVEGQYENIAVEEEIDGEYVDVFKPAVYRKNEEGKLTLVEEEKYVREPKKRVVQTKVWVEGHYIDADAESRASQQQNDRDDRIVDDDQADDDGNE